MDFSLPSLRQMVTSLAWPSSWRWRANLEEEHSNLEEEASSKVANLEEEVKCLVEDAAEPAPERYIFLKELSQFT